MRASFCASFNSRSHAGSDDVLSLLSSLLPVSIHAPTRGATVLPRLDAERVIVSIHAPTRGATLKKL